MESSVWNRMFSRGMRAAKEKMFSIAERILNNTDNTRNFLYGGTNRRNTCRNSFINFCKGTNKKQ